jgi:hypothetical protein
VTVISLGGQRLNTASVAQKKEIFPPSALLVRFARAAIPPLMPAPAKFAKCARASPAAVV